MDADAAAALVRAAPAKINLYLEVLGQRPDGYHEIVTCMTPLALADELSFTPADALTLLCDDPSLPLDENNLVLKAALALQRHTGASPGAAIRLTKRVPTAAGLGGGSSDAASTLRGLNQLWHRNVPDEELMALAAQLGSDVPFFLLESAGWCRGRGERVEPTKPAATLHLLLLCPMVGLSTAAVYGALDSPPLLRGTPGGVVDTSFHLVPLAHGVDEMKQAVEQGDAERVGRTLFNRLQAPAERLLPLLAEIRQLLDDLAPEDLFWGHQMSGSGSSYFVVCRGEAEAQRLARLVITRWVGGVLISGMGTAQPPDASNERTLRLYVTRSA